MSSATMHHFSSHSSPFEVMNAHEPDGNAAASTATLQPPQPNSASQIAPPSVHHSSPGATAPQLAAQQTDPGETVSPTAAEPPDRLTDTRPGAAIHHNSSLSAPLPSAIDHPQATRMATSDNPCLSGTQNEVIVHLAQGSSVSAAARAAGIHRTTIHHWQRTSKEFNTALEQARSEYAETINDEMHDLAAESVRTLRDLLTNPDTSPAVRLRTALAILERPRFPHPGWHLPAEIHPEHERQFLDRLAAVEADYNTLRMSRSAARATPVHQNSSQNDLSELMSLMNARMPPATAAGPAPVHHNSPQSALAELMSLMNAHTPPAMAHTAQPARNSLCPCGSGKKYKRCCGQSGMPVLSAVA